MTVRINLFCSIACISYYDWCFVLLMNLCIVLTLACKSHYYCMSSLQVSFLSLPVAIETVGNFILSSRWRQGNEELLGKLVPLQ